ncbi:hypothetical protein NFI96_005453 [Prochilodus magdalenae]|nr:hypothetical protein NFI96_005453 [Prochilodus magdalenae]
MGCLLLGIMAIGKKGWVCILIVICIIIIIAVFVSKKPKTCPDGSFSKAAVVVTSKTCSEVGRNRQLAQIQDGTADTEHCTTTELYSLGTVKVINARETVPKGFKGDLSYCSYASPGGTLTLEDLSLFEVSEFEPWNVSLGDYTMYFPPPPSGGALVSFILNVMEGYNLGPASLQSKEERVLTYHRYIEACKFANGLRKLMRDPRFGSDKEASAITQKEFADRIRGMIKDNRTHDAQYYNISSDLDTPGTTHMSILDEDGMAVSVTSSINYLFGCGDFSNKTGIILNNQVTDFCGKAQQVQAGERSPSSMAPMILRSTATDHTVVIGASGGSWITSALTMALMNYLWLEKSPSLKTSIAAPLVHVDSGTALHFESNFDTDVMEALRGLGHTVKNAGVFYNVVSAVSRRKGECIEAVSDARRMALPAGY